MVVKGVRDSLLEKLEKCSDLKFEASKILKIAEEVEIAMFGKATALLERLWLILFFQEHLGRWEPSTRISTEA